MGDAGALSQNIEWVNVPLAIDSVATADGNPKRYILGRHHSKATEQSEGTRLWSRWRHH